MGTLKKLTFTFIFLNLILNIPVLYSDTDESWQRLKSGVESYSADNKLKENFKKLCQQNPTAVINGKVETGSGLYMTIDVPVYLQPDRNKIAELPDRTTVVLTGETDTKGSKEWVQIKFLYISSNTETAVDIEDGWVEKSFLK